MVRDSKEKTLNNNHHTIDAFFRTSYDATEFFKRKDRSREIDTADVDFLNHKSVLLIFLALRCTNNFMEL